jgi:hypothetical protein
LAYLFLQDPRDTPKNIRFIIYGPLKLSLRITTSPYGTMAPYALKGKGISQWCISIVEGHAVAVATDTGYKSKATKCNDLGQAVDEADRAFN